MLTPASFPRLFPALRIDPDGHGAIIVEGDIHHRTEPTGPNGPAQARFESIDKIFVEWYRNVRVSCPLKTGTGAFLDPGVKGELAHDEGFSSGIENGPVHLSFVIFEDSEREKFADEPVDVFLAVFLFDPKQEQHSGADSALFDTLNRNVSVTHTLQQYSHGNL